MVALQLSRTTFNKLPKPVLHLYMPSWVNVSYELQNFSVLGLEMSI